MSYSFILKAADIKWPYKICAAEHLSCRGSFWWNIEHELCFLQFTSTSILHLFALTDLLNKLKVQFQNIHYLLISVFVDMEELWNFILKSQICLLFCIFSLLPALVTAAINDSDCTKEKSFPPTTFEINLTVKKI